MLVRVGDVVEPGTVVARTELPGNVQIVNLAAKLSIDPAKAVDSLLQPVGSTVAADEPIAFAKGLFGFGRTEVKAPCSGVIESVSPVTGQLVLREPPIPVEVTAYVSGRAAPSCRASSAWAGKRAARSQCR